MSTGERSSTIEAMKQALEAFTASWSTEQEMWKVHQMHMNAITTLRTAIEEAEKQSAERVEPVAWMYWQSCLNDDGTQTAPWVQRYSKFKPPESVINKEITPLYTTPPYAATPLAAQRQWVGLTDEEIGDALSVWELTEEWPTFAYAARAIEAKLKEKNHHG
jgi:hypothetical protein